MYIYIFSIIYTNTSQTYIPRGYTTTQRTNTYTTYDHTDDSTFGELLGIADLTGPRLPKCNNHLVSFMKVDGLFIFISYIVNILTPLNQELWSIVLWIVDILTSLNQERWLLVL